jgi:N6-L-threonylcarbamoyladenine synthase
MLILGIETSCDETGAAVVRSNGEVLSDVVQSQVKVHAPYGGVVPELASRDHLKNARPVVSEALSRAGVSAKELGGIAVTCRPGLTGALLVGVEVAEGLAFGLDKPVVGVDHLVGHLLSPFLRFSGLTQPDPPAFPFVALLASGGHTALYRVDAPGLERIRELGATRDDAAGEAFDKVAKLLGLGYPGGPVIDRLAKEGDPDGVELVWPMRRRGSLEFSFSGLKTDVMRWVMKNGLPSDDALLRNLCASFQRRVVDTLVMKLVAAAKGENVRTIVVAGGVAANRELRERAQARADAEGLTLVVPPFRACTDNAAMIAYAGSKRLERGEDDSGKLRTSPRTALPRVTHKGRGKRAAS